MIVLILLSWYLSGVLSFLYWWRKDYDFSTDEIPIALLVGYIGPMAYIGGFFIHGFDKNKKVIFKRKY